MSAPSVALEYTVAPDGRVETAGHYRVVPAEYWAQLRPVRSGRHSPYEAMLKSVREGQTVALSVDSAKRAWDKERQLRRLAARLGVRIETKRGGDPARADRWVLLARLATD